MPNALVSAIREVIERYHLALDRREHNGIAAGVAVAEIEDLLDMPWVKGEALRRRSSPDAM